MTTGRKRRARNGLIQDELDGGLVYGQIVACLPLQLVRVTQRPHELAILNRMSQVALAEDEHEDGDEVVSADVHLVDALGLQARKNDELKLAVDGFDRPCKDVQLCGRSQV